MSGSSLPPRSVFISYARDDRAFAHHLADGLRARGIEVWIDVETVEAGHSWADAIDQALADAQLCIVVVSAASNPADPRSSSEWSKMQGTVWARGDLKILPVIIGDAEVPSFLRRWQAVRVPITADTGQLTEAVIDSFGADVGSTPNITQHEIEQTRKRFDEIRDSLASMKYSR